MANLGTFISSTIFPFAAVHLAMLPNGDFISWAYGYNTSGVMDKIAIHRYDINTKTFQHFTSINYPSLINNTNNVFCSCHVTDKFGNLIVAGGQKKKYPQEDQNDDGTNYLGKLIETSNPSEPYS